jgi:NAD(P)-dependent dehydrogenase (short-subunit alcohol dehydrogenase family)
MSSRTPGALQPERSPFDSTLLGGQVAIVTGGGTGLGRAVARELGRAGATVVLAARRPDPLASTVSAFQAEGLDAWAATVDIRRSEQVAALVEQVVSRSGRIDILVNNAGGQFPARAEDLTDGGWNAVIETNLNGTFRMTRAVGKQFMRQGGGGAITNILIPSLFRGIPGIAHSVAARAGVWGLTKTLAREWAPSGIRINAVGPGVFVTEGFQQEMASAVADEVVDRLAGTVPLGRTGRPEELGWLVVYLSSPLAAFMTGEYIVLDGGQSLEAGLSLLGEDRWRDEDKGGG